MSNVKKHSLLGDHDMKFSLPLPPAINRTYKTGKGVFYKAVEAKDWERLADQMLSYKKINPVSDECIVHLDYYFKTKGRDVDSSIKIVLDTLQRNRVLSNDRIVKRVIATKYKDKFDPRVEVEITLW